MPWWPWYVVDQEDLVLMITMSRRRRVKQLFDVSLTCSHTACVQDENGDGKLSYEEFRVWWMSPNRQSLRELAEAAGYVKGESGELL